MRFHLNLLSERGIRLFGREPEGGSKRPNHTFGTLNGVMGVAQSRKGWYFPNETSGPLELRVDAVELWDGASEVFSTFAQLSVGVQSGKRYGVRRYLSPERNESNLLSLPLKTPKFETVTDSFAMAMRLGVYHGGWAHYTDGRAPTKEAVRRLEVDDRLTGITHVFHPLAGDARA